MLGHIAAASAAAVHNNATVLPENCGLKRVGPTLQGFGTFGVHGNDGPVYSIKRSSVQTGGVTKQLYSITTIESANSAAQEPRGRQANLTKNKRAKATTQSYPDVAAKAVLGQKSKQNSKFDDFFTGGRRDVEERTRRAADDDADNGVY